MADINEIISKEAIAGLERADKALTSMDDHALKVVAAFNALQTALGAGGMSLKDFNVLQSNAIKAQKEQEEAQKAAIKAQKEHEAALKTLIKEGEKRVAQIEKEARAERELAASAKIMVTTIKEAEQQNSALTKILKTLHPAIAEEKKQMDAINATIKKNTQFIIENADAETKRIKNIGNYPKEVSLAQKSVGDLRREMMALRNVSLVGKSAQEIQEINKKIGDVTDQLGDLKAMQKSMGTELGTQVAGSVKVISAAVEGLAGGMALLGVGEDNIQKVQKNLVALMAVTQALGEIEDAMQKRTIQNTVLRLRQSAAEAWDAAAKWTNTTATIAATRAEESRAIITGKASLATKAAAAVQWLWNAALAANPIGLVVTAVAALVGIIGILILTSNKASAATTQIIDTNIRASESYKIHKEAIQDVAKTAAVSLNDEKMKLEQLRKAVGDTTLSMGKRKKALEEIIALDPEHLKGLTLEEAAYGRNSLRIAKYIEILDATTKAKAIEGKMSELYLKQFENEQKIKDAGYAVELYNIMRINTYKKIASGEGDATDEANFGLYLSKLEAAKKTLAGLQSEQKSLTKTTDQLSAAYTKIMPSMKLNENLQDSTTKKVEKEVKATQKLTDEIDSLQNKITALAIANKPIDQGLIHQLALKKDELKQLEERVKTLTSSFIELASKGTKGITFGGGTDARSILSTKGTGQGAASAPDQFNNSLFDTKGDAQKFAIEGAQVLADTTFNIMANSDQAALDLKLSNLEKEKEAKLKNFKGTEAEREKIEAQFKKREDKIRTESLKKQKAANIIQAIMNTALAIGNALATGGAAAPALAIMAGITGAAQMAIIAATKIPQFAGGSLSTPADFVVGESGPEFVRTKNKGWELVTAPMLKLNAPGSQVISATETRRMMELGITPAGGSNPIPAIEAMHSDIVNTIRGKREVHISASGRKVTETENGNKTSWANRKINWMN